MKELDERLCPAAEESGTGESTRKEGEEMTRRSELPAPSAAQPAEKMNDEELFRLVQDNAGVRARVLGEYLQTLKGVPLMTGGGAGVTAPVQKPKNIREAGALALGYLKKK